MILGAMQNTEQEQQAQFFPFHVINEFMRDDYRLSVLQKVFTALKNISPAHSKPINQIIQRTVKVPGFRNSLQAPLFIKVKSCVSTFEHNPEFVAHTLAAWAELHPDLRQQVFDLLTGRGWELLPAEADRTRMPGFYADKWRKGETFEAINRAFDAAYPEGASISDDDVSLMVVWLSLCLPFSEETDSTEEPSAESQTDQS